MKPRLQLVQGVVATEILAAMHESVRRLQAAGVRHALIGGLAVGAYGHPRATKDVDFIVGQEAFTAHEGGILLFAEGVPYSIERVPVDCLLVDEPQLLSAIDYPEMSCNVPVAPIEALVYLKLKAGRRQDIADVVHLLDAGLDIARARQFLQAFPVELEAFDRLVTETAPT